MHTFGLITEGVTDQHVIQAVLEGCFDPEEIDVSPFSPIADNTYKHAPQSFSNWELVLEYCASPNFVQAFDYVSYIVVQIDTDQCEDAKFGVQKHNEGHLLPAEEIVARVAAKLQRQIGDAVWDVYHERILFAVAVDTIECWLLPLYVLEAKGKARTLNCLDFLNRSLRKQDLRPITPDSKEPRLYKKLAGQYSKGSELAKHGNLNPSLAIFLERVKKTFPTTTEDATSADAAKIVAEITATPDEQTGL